MNEPCPFCEIVAGRAPATYVREWHHTIAITPLNPVTSGHILVIPKLHVEDFTENPTVTAATAKRASELGRDLDLKAVNLITSKGAEATQSVKHLHLHLVPRSNGDALPPPWDPRGEGSARTKAEVTDRLTVDTITSNQLDALQLQAARMEHATKQAAEAALSEARATNQRLNRRAQELESELAAYHRAVRQWEVSERGTYIPHSSLRTIGKACGVDVLGTVRHLKHFERVEQAEAAIERAHEAVNAGAPLEKFMAGDEPTEYARGWAAAMARVEDALDGQRPVVGEQSDTQEAPQRRHVYLSTGCYHGDEPFALGLTGHEYCQNRRGVLGVKQPGRCKGETCGARCVCACHQTGAQQNKEE